MSDAAPSVLRRMIRRARPGGAASARAEGVRIELARIADDLHGLEAAVVSTSFASVERADIELGERDLIYQMMHDTLPSGLVTLSPELLATLIEVQIAGRVVAAGPPERMPTRTDGVVCAPMIDAWVEALSTGEVAQDALRGFRRGAMIDGPKAAQLTLDSGRFKILTYRLSLGGGVREGQVTFHLPEQLKDGGASDGNDLTFLTVELDVVLTRLRRPLGRVRALKPGDVIEIESDALGQASLEHGGRKLASVRLGRVDETRAIRIAEPGEPPVAKAAFQSDESSGGTKAKEVRAHPVESLPPGEVIAALPPLGGDGDSHVVTSDLSGLPSLDGPPPGDELPPLDDLPALDDLPPLNDLPPLDDLPPLPELEES